MEEIENILKRLEEVGMQNFEKEILQKSSPISKDFKVLTDQVKEYLEEENEMEECCKSGMPIIRFTLNL